jgi:hypothetical protein
MQIESCHGFVRHRIFSQDTSPASSRNLYPYNEPDRSFHRRHVEVMDHVVRGGLYTQIRIGSRNSDRETGLYKADHGQRMLKYGAKDLEDKQPRLLDLVSLSFRSRTSICITRYLTTTAAIALFTAACTVSSTCCKDTSIILDSCPCSLLFATHLTASEAASPVAGPDHGIQDPDKVGTPAHWGSLASLDTTCVLSAADRCLNLWSCRIHESPGTVESFSRRRPVAS